MDGTTLYPTILNLVAAAIIVIWNSIVLCVYFFGKAVEERWATHDDLANVVQNTLTALATAIMLGTASDPASLENQTCSNSPPTSNSASICFLQVL
jgi:amino acid permease